MTYIIEAHPEQRNIIIKSVDVKAFSNVNGAVITDGTAILPFNQETAVLLSNFLKGETFKMSLKTKTILGHLKKGTNLKFGDNWVWELDLHTLRENVVNSRSKSLRTEWDLIHYMPLRYIDKSNPQNITDLTLNMWCVVVGEITSIKYIVRADAVVVTIRDITGATITSWFFRQRWLIQSYHEGDTVVISGTFSEYVDKRTGRVEERITNATLDAVGKYETSHKVVPVYSEKVGKKKWVISKEIEKMLEKVAWIDDPVPDVLLEKYNLMSRNDAYRKIHFPDSIEEAIEARKRIAFDDFVRLQVFLGNVKNDEQTTRIGNVMNDETLTDAFINALPFTFTGAQQRVVDEIRADMQAEKPMRRLLHGDVGSGKSEVAAAAALRAVASGKQVALLAPTAILASQLLERFENDFRKAGLSDLVNIGLLHTGVKVSEKRRLLQETSDGTLNMLVGTHSILNKDVVFKDLGLIIIDEQHKFGTKHRQMLQENHLRNSSVVPDLLMMSATPIPRTMSQTIFGDMDISVIDELPASRKPVFTFWEETDEPAWDTIREQVNEGHQAYVIAALVDESDSEKLEDVENATQMHTYLQTSIFPELKVGLVHGKMKPAEKSAVLEAYYKNEIQVLVSTSVIEVGVNVPNATVMVILNANRFGIASLHQIRGRVGRGSSQAYCYLIGAATNPDAEERLNAMVASNDGFWLAEKDLEIRGEGSLLNESQHGENDMIIANLREHRPLLTIAQRVAPQAAKSEKMQDEVSYLFGEGKISA